MRVLVMGGTRLVGRQIVNAANDRGHDVTVFNRGLTAPEGMVGVTSLVGDRDSDLSALRSAEWDATIDVTAYVGRQVSGLLEALDGRGGHYSLISSISVYGSEVAESGFTENEELVDPAWDDTYDVEKYGELKVACEQRAADLTSGRALIVRPGYVIGPYDYTERFTHWVKAVAAGQPFAAPAADQPLQCIDGRDLGAFTISCVERQLVDTFNVTAPQDPPTFAEVLAEIAAALGVDLPQVNWAAPDAPDADELPLGAGLDWWPKMRADLSHAVDAGLTWRPLGDTVRDLAAQLAQ